jgi:hypothetical protein
MAAKGHSYEISNKKAVSSFIVHFWLKARDRDLEKAAEWINSNHFSRYVTGQQFTYPLKLAHVMKTDDKEESSPHILGKVAGGAEVRRFSEFLFESKGPDLEHILDWISDLKARGHRDYDKVPRMTVDVVIRKAKEWTEALGRLSKGTDDQAELVLAIDSEMAWYELTSATSLRFEGNLMSHCVGAESYVTRVTNGKARILSLRFDTHKPVLTLEIDTSNGLATLIQIQKQANGGLPLALCDAVTSILNQIGADDAHARGPRYGLVLENGTWSTIYDKWMRIDCVGRTALSDGTKTLFMCVTDPSKPLLLANFIRDEVEVAVSVKSASDIPPHYTDQLEAADIVSRLKADANKWHGMNAYWLAENRETSTIVPAVDLYERRDADGMTLYIRPPGYATPEAFLLPPGSDPARIIMEASEVRGLKRAKVCDEQRISRSQVQRCLAFLDYVDVNYIGIADDPHREPETKEFRRAFDPVRAGRVWKAFALACARSDAVKSDGKWETTDYLVRYRGKKGGHLELTLSDNRIVGSYSWGVRREDLKEIVSQMNKRKLGSEAAIKVMGSFETEFPILLAMHDEKWVVADGPVEAVRLADRVLSKGTKSRQENILSGLLDYVAEVIHVQTKKERKIDNLLRVKHALLSAWFNTVRSFDGYLVHRKSLFWSSDRHIYSLVDRLCDLADGGYTPESPKQITQLKKCLKRVVKAYGRGKIRYPLEDEFAEVAIRWYKYLPKASLNKISGVLVTFKTWEETHDAASAYLALLNDQHLGHTKLWSAIFDRSEKLVRDADYSNLTQAQIEAHARLFDRTVLRKWIGQYHLKDLSRLLEVLEPWNEEMSDIYTRLRKAKDELDNGAPYSSPAKPYTAEAWT